MTARTPSAAALLLVTGLLVACGGGSQPAPAGSTENPLVATTQTPTPAPGTRSGPSSGRSNEGATLAKGAGEGSGSRGAGARAGTQSRYQKLVQRQSQRPRSRFTPCNLVTKDEARAIVGSAVQEPLEAPQGPTCIYRSADGKGFITVAIQSQSFRKLERRLQRPERVSVASRAAYCGTYGQPVLYLPLSRGRVLSIAARCPTARQFASKAIRRIAP